MEIKYIKVDETNYWSAGFVSALGGAKMEVTYLFDASVRTYCCDLSPSYWMVYAGTDAIPGSRDLTESDYEAIMEAEAVSDNDHYRYCRDVRNAKDFEGDFETLDDALEEFRANPQ